VNVPVLDIAHAIAIGLLRGLREEPSIVADNTSPAGASLALVDRASLNEMENVRELVEVVELNLAPIWKIVTLST